MGQIVIVHKKDGTTRRIAVGFAGNRCVNAHQDALDPARHEGDLELRRTTQSEDPQQERVTES